MPDGESEWIARARRGDDDAFGRLALLHRDRVRGLLHRLLGPDGLDDLEQEVFVAAWRGIRRFRGDASFATWLTRIAVNRARRVMRRRRPPPSRLETEPADRAPGPEAAFGAAERNGLVLQAVDALSPKLRVAFVLRHVEGMSGEEVARVLEIPAGTVRRRLHDARRRLAETLGEEILE
jgi:RNA polymerase sigma-70 factor (ECF subfamily)